MLKNHRLKAYLYLLVTSIIWGTAGPVIKYTLSGIPALSFLFYRLFLSSIFSLFILLKNKKHIPPVSQFANIFLYSIFAVSVSLGFLFIGLEKTTMLETTVITTFNPLLMTLAGAIFFNDRITSKEKLGTIIAFLGTLIAISQPLLEKKDGATVIGNTLVFTYILANTASAVIAKKLARNGVSPMFTANFSFIIGFITLIPLAINAREVVIQPILNLRTSYYFGILYMALISGNLGYYLWIKGQKTIEISEASLFSYLQPLFSAPLAVFWLGEKITPIFVVGALTIAIGVIIAETKKGLLLYSKPK